jgi:hypothetical protein
MEPRFKIIGNEVKEQSRERQPFITNYTTDHDYSAAWRKYEQHLASLRTYMASEELKAAFGKNEFGEKDFWVGTEDYVNQVAYPVSQEQESQEVNLWNEAAHVIYNAKKKPDTPIENRNILERAFSDMSILSQHYTITKNK